MPKRIRNKSSPFTSLFSWQPPLASGTAAYAAIPRFHNSTTAQITPGLLPLAAASELRQETPDH